MSVRKCSKCGLEKSLEEFYKRKIGLRAGEFYEKCKECYKIRGRTYYHDNRKRQVELALLRKHRYKTERKEFVDAIKRGKPCSDCQKVYPPWVMDFDHREGEIKLRSISHMVVKDTSNIEKIKLEIKKCDLVCSNCHRQRTYERLKRIISPR